ncbi:MAG: PLP-dependent transferase, partial [Alphaproteobacteria bacterium]|nr:PLP-dependent transferase [Alphaproteobacteria bacterium]
MRERDRRTVAAANGIASDANYGAVTPPLYLSSTFAFSGFEKHRGYEYSRTANPGRDVLADTLAKLEGGIGAVITSSGMAAVDLVLSLAGRDDLVVAPHDCYGGTYRLLSARRDKGHFDVVFVNQSDAAALA